MIPGGKPAWIGEYLLAVCPAQLIRSRSWIRRYGSTKIAGGGMPDAGKHPRLPSVLLLENDNVQIFQEKCFYRAIPALLPHGTFSSLPACTRWFCANGRNANSAQLNKDYLLGFGDPLVPLELIRSSDDDHGYGAETFQRLRAPLSLFLEWITAKDQSQEQLYLAQASLSDLPTPLQSDLPVPRQVISVGKGDIYDSNLWIGLAPTYTPLHRDPNPNLFVQLAGAKLVRMYEPEAGVSIFRQIQQHLGRDASAVFRGEEMMNGPEKSMLEEVVWGDGASATELRCKPFEVSVRAGDGLFIPKGWWHSIKGVGSGITASVSKIVQFCLWTGH